MKPKDVVPMIAHTLSLPVGNRPAIGFESNPGMGKTAMTYQGTQRANGLMVDVRPATRDPVDVGGYPCPDMAHGIMRYLRPAIFPPADIVDRPVTWFLDELDKCATANQNALLGAIQERRVHEHALGDNVSIIAARNPDGSRSGGVKLTTALVSRITWIQVENDLQSTLEYALDTDWDMRVIVFLRLRGEGTQSEPGLLNNFDPAVSGPYACQRQWEATSKIVQAGYPDHVRNEMIRGTIGAKAGSEFLAYLQLADEMPDPMAVLLDPQGSPVPTKPGVLYGLMGALANLASQSNFANVVAYANRVPPAFGVFSVTAALRKHPEIKKTAAFTQWAIKNQDVLT